MLPFSLFLIGFYFVFSTGLHFWWICCPLFEWLELFALLIIFLFFIGLYSSTALTTKVLIVLIELGKKEMCSFIGWWPVELLKKRYIKCRSDILYLFFLICTIGTNYSCGTYILVRNDWSHPNRNTA